MQPRNSHAVTTDELLAPEIERSIGFVSLVGAGPGDPELLTLKALNRVQAAQAIVHDALIPHAILDLIPAASTRYDVGKRMNNDRSANQDDINALLVRLAWKGLRVVRLKGGDPFIFGRGGEEAEALTAHGVPWEVVPAVSAFNGAGASARVPLTHRGLSHGFTVLEGHQAGLARIRWPDLVRLGGTWVFYMAKSTVMEIARNLIIHGADRYLPLAVIENATLPNQTVTRMTLQAASERGYASLTPGPGIVIVGGTVDVLSHPSIHLPMLIDHGFALPAVP